jgi:adenylate kinase family enzyme
MSAHLRQLRISKPEWVGVIDKAFALRQLVPDYIAIPAMRMMGDEAKKIRHLVLEGQGRTHAQMEELLRLLLKQWGFIQVHIYYLRCPREVCLRRCLTRKRADDERLAVQNRLNEFEKETLPAVTFAKRQHNGFSLFFNEIDVSGDNLHLKVRAILQGSGHEAEAERIAGLLETKLAAGMVMAGESRNQSASIIVPSGALATA